MISVQAWSAEAKLQGPHPLVQAGPHPCPTPHREDLKGSEEEQDAEGSGEVAWLWICHGSKVPSRQQQVFSGVTAAMLEQQSSAPSHPYPQLSSFLKTLAESDIVVLPGPPESGTECGWCSCQEVAPWILTLVEVLAWEEASVLWSWTHKDCERQM